MRKEEFPTKQGGGKMYRFFGRKYSRFILLIKEGKNIHDYSKLVDMTPSHLSNVADHWARLGLIKKIKKGRETEMEFTEDGLLWKDLIQQFEEMATKYLNKIKNKNERKS